jgi:SAM-dependent methyltransferase
MLKQLHHKFIFLRRIKILSRELSVCIDSDTITILDIGCGDGAISKLMRDSNTGLKISGIDIVARPHCAIPFKLYDGKHIPFDDNSFDVCMLVDVLHHLPHIKDIKELLTEAKRVSGKYILIKDHQYKNRFDFKTLKFMDDIGNKPHGIAVEYNYLKENEWHRIFNDAGLTIVKRKVKIPLYAFPFNLFFGRKLHFISCLKISK